MGLMITSKHAIDFFTPGFICPSLMPIHGSFQESNSFIPSAAQLKSCHKTTLKGRSDKKQPKCSTARDYFNTFL